MKRPRIGTVSALLLLSLSGVNAAQPLHLLKDIAPFGGSAPYDPVEFGGRVVFFTYDFDRPRLWITDGTEAGTSMVWTFPPPSYPRGQLPRGFSKFHDRVFFAAGDTPSYIVDDHLWQSDGTPAGTYRVSGFRPPIHGNEPTDLTQAEGALFFVTKSNFYGRDLWRTDGSPAGALRVMQVGFSLGDVGVQGLAPFGRGVLFAWVGSYRTGLWSTDGTVDGTARIADVDGLPYGDYLEGTMRAAGSFVVFPVLDDARGLELWRSDGTEAGTAPILDVCPGPCGSAPEILAVRDGIVYFRADDGIHGRELWRSDGSEAGTRLVVDGCPGNCSANLRGVIAGTDRVFWVIAEYPVPRNQLWTAKHVDGEAELVAKFDGSYLALFGVIDDVALFGLGGDLWRSDGTSAGTVVVQRGLGPSWTDETFYRPAGFVPPVTFGSRIFFAAYEPIQGAEPWVGYTSIVLGKPELAIADLRSAVVALHLPPGIEQSLVAKLDAAARAVAERRATAEAIGQLEALARETGALASNRIPGDAAAEIQLFAGQIVELLSQR